MNDIQTRRHLLKIPPFIILGAVLISLPLVFFITYQNIERQQAHTQYLLLERGTALIRSFEAGTRAGMRGNQWGNWRLQQLLEETAQQSYIVHITVTDQDGTIIAHNETDQIGKRYSSDLDLSAILSSNHFQWRIIEPKDSPKLFEVYKRFSPVGRPGNPNREGMMRRFRGGPQAFPQFHHEDAQQVIFIGLDMTSLDEAEKSALMNSIFTGVLIFLAGSAGIVLLFLLQNVKSTRASLLRIKAFSDHLVSNMPIGLIALDTSKTVTSVNAAAEEILGQPYAEVIGRKASQILPAMLLELLNGIEQTGKIIGYETEGDVTPNKSIPMEVSISTITDDSHHLIGYALLLKDLTEIYQLRKEVARSQRLASIGRLAAGVAHEIRNPLSSIKGFATYFRDRYRENKKDHQTANVMINEVDRLDRVVGQLLELARPVKIMPQSTEIGSFVDDTVRLIEQELTNKEITLQIERQDSPCNLTMDRDKVNQVLLNLYLNAIDAMEPGGLLKIGYWHNPLTDAILFTVADSGSGIAEKDLAKIFDPYYTTKPTGTGLGLAIVHNILEAHHGKIKVESTPGTGTLVTVTIPNLNVEKTDDR